MKSPYQRLIEACGVTQVQFQDAFKFSKPTLIQIMSGQYANLSERMIDSIYRLCLEKGIQAGPILKAEYGDEHLQDAYHNWQYAERMSVAGKYMVAPPMGWSKNLSPFDAYVSKTAGSRARFCKDLKVDAARVRGYATGQSASMPYVIETALRVIGYPWMPELIALQENWRTEWVS